ncbi:MAG TPA: type II 3-dehydroquinate dehydratase [Acidimicrobiia bacterium]
MRILVINGPNLDLLGRREPEVYGSTTLADLDAMVSGWGTDLDVAVSSRQTNSEAEIIDLIHDFDCEGLVINPGALTHTSHAIADAIRGVSRPAVEVHISNVRRREPWRAVSLVSDACVRTIYGRGMTGYRDALRHLVNRAAVAFETVAYGPHHDNVGDVRLGTGGTLVVLSHGGFWRGEYERDTTESLAVDLAGRGYHSWNLEYRRLDEGGGWPASGQDVLTALDHIPNLGLDHERVVLIGHSAGSHLAMWAAARSSTKVSLHVALGPLLDLQAAVDHEDPGAKESLAMLVHGAPSVIEPGEVPTVIVHGDNDDIVPVNRSVAFAAQHDLEHHRSDYDHFSVLDPRRPEWDWVIERIGPP